jgi:hypothetical protein
MNKERIEQFCESKKHAQDGQNAADHLNAVLN